jgi:hypothetical protein
MPRRLARLRKETKRSGQRMRPKISLFAPNPFAVAERLGIGTQISHGENDETEVDQV